MAKEKVDMLLIIGFIREVNYPSWLANLALVRKHSGKWMICVDHANLNKACPRTTFPYLASISLSTWIRKPTMKLYSSSNSMIMMVEEDEMEASFIIDWAHLPTNSCLSASKIQG